MKVMKTISAAAPNKTKLIACLLMFISNFALSEEAIIYSETLGFKEGKGYVETIGIPSPSLNVSKIAPVIDDSSWKVPEDGLYYINTKSKNASDLTNGTPQNPRKTIPTTIPPGSYIKVEGEYDISSGGYTFINANGDDQDWKQGVSGPVWLVGEGAVFTKGVVIQGSNLFIEGIQFGLENGEGGRFLIGSSKPRFVKNVVIRNNVFYGINGSEGQAGSALLVTGVNEDSPAENIFIFDNKFFNNGDVNADYDQDFHMVQVDKGVNGYWFVNNLIQFASGSGVQVLGATESTKNIYIGSNTITNVRQSGVGVKYGSDIIISQNVMKNIIDTRPLYTASPSPSKGVSYQYGPQNIWILFNDISLSSNGIYGASTNDGEWNIYIVGNYIHDISSPNGVKMGGGAWADAAMMLQGGQYRYIVNNTIRNVNSGINGPANNSLYNISQNVISGVNDGNYVYIQNGNSANFNGNSTGDVYKGSLVSSFDGAVVDKKNNIIWGSINSNLSEIRTSNFCWSSSCFNSDNIFEGDVTELSLGGAKLISQSNGHNLGTRHIVYDTFIDLYGLSINFDIYGIKRTGLWDIGSVDNSEARDDLVFSVPNVPVLNEILIMK